MILSWHTLSVLTLLYSQRGMVEEAGRNAKSKFVVTFYVEEMYPDV